MGEGTNRRAGGASMESLEARRLMAATPFTVALLSDSQYVVEAFPQTFHAQTQWLADNAGTLGLDLVTHQGDLLRRGYSTYQINNADAALDRLNGVVPYSVSIGNHDYDNQFDDLDHHISAAKFAETFGAARYANSAAPWGGWTPDQANHYQVFDGGGRPFLLLSLEWEASDAAIAWAQGVINSHRHLPVILSTHEYLRTSGRSTTPLDKTTDSSGQLVYNSGEGIYQKLVRPNPQIFMVVNGHTGGEHHQTSLNNAGSQVFEIIADYSGRTNGGDGWLQLLRFDPTANSISATTYSPTRNAYETDANSQYTLPINFATRFAFAPAGVPIANDEMRDVAPGNSVTFDVRANDYEPDNQTLAVTLRSNPANGTLTPHTDGAFTYTPNAGFSGTDSFTYSVSDGVNSSNTATVRLRVNTAPAGVDDLVRSSEGKAVTVNVVGNDIDDDGNALRPILATLPVNGAVFVNASGTLAYTPDPKFTGTDSFTYFASDGVALSAARTVTIDVRANAQVYDYPVAQSTVYGTVTAGDLSALRSSDDVEQSIREVLRSGVSDFEQRWQFNVTGGTDVTFAIKARRTWGPDEFHLQYSTNGGSTWLDMTRLVPTSSLDITRVLHDADQPYQIWALPATTRGTVWVRATDVGSADASLETLGVDEMFIRSGVVWPAVSIAAAGGAENGAAAVFTVTRAGSTANSLTVPYTVGGSAEPGVDYHSLSGSVTIPPGASSATFSAAAIADPFVEGNETVVVTLAASDAFDVTTAVATATILDGGPQGVAAVAVSASQIDLSWSDTLTDEEGFRVERTVDGVQFSTVATLPAGASAYSDTGLAQGTRYYYQVVAFRGDASAASVTVSAMTQTPAPLAPGSLTAAKLSKSRVRLTWRDNSANENGFYLYSSRDGITWTRMATAALLSGTGGMQTYTTGTLARGTWYFRVASFNAGGESSPSNEVSVLL